MSERRANRPDSIEEASRRGLLTLRPHRGDKPGIGAPGPQRLGIGGTRDAVLYIPRRYDPGVPAPLLILLHGAGGEAHQMLGPLTEAAEARGILLLAPDSRGRSWDVIVGSYGPDVAFLDQALAHVFERYQVDAERIGIGGFSDGASYALSIGLINGALF